MTKPSPAPPPAPHSAGARFCRQTESPRTGCGPRAPRRREAVPFPSAPAAVPVSPPPPRTAHCRASAPPRRAEPAARPGASATAVPVRPRRVCRRRAFPPFRLCRQVTTPSRFSPPWGGPAPPAGRSRRISPSAAGFPPPARRMFRAEPAVRPHPARGCIRKQINPTHGGRRNRTVLLACAGHKSPADAESTMPAPLPAPHPLSCRTSCSA